MLMPKMLLRSKMLLLKEFLRRDGSSDHQPCVTGVERRERASRPASTPMRFRRCCAEKSNTLNRAAKDCLKRQNIFRKMSLCSTTYQPAHLTAGGQP